MTLASQQVRSGGSYSIARRLGAGGMAEVFLAVQRMAGGVERVVVVKSILPHLAEDEAFVEMFLREARIATMLAHPNVAHIHDVTVVDGRPCIVMEFLRGRDLSNLMRRVAKGGGHVDPVVAAIVVAQAASGLDHAHKKRDDRGRALSLVHRDVSPHNLFVGRDGIVRVLDFGIARSALDDGLTDGDVLKGKLAYMAPEYIQARVVAPSIDQFAMGIVLWEMLTGRRLFSRPDPLDTMQAVIASAVSAPSVTRPAVPVALDRVALRALAADPSQRFTDCGAMALALRAWLRSVDAPDEAQVASEWLAQLAPLAEDTDLYALDANGSVSVALPEAEATESDRDRRTRPKGAVPRDDDATVTPAPSAVVDRPRLVTKTLETPDEPDASTRSIVPAVRTPSDVAVTRPREASPTEPLVPRSPSRWRWAIALALVLVVTVIATTAWFALPSPAGTPPPVARTLAIPPPTTSAVREPVLVRIANPPADAVVEVDGHVVSADGWLTQPSTAPRVVRVTRHGEELLSITQIVDGPTTIALPELPAPAHRPARTSTRRPPRTSASTPPEASVTTSPPPASRAAPPPHALPRGLIVDDP